MSFWGIELKPKKPYTLKYSDFEAPRLHLSQATLRNVKSDERTILRCKVTESPLLYLCSLRPGHAESCSLDFFFDEDVTFSVKGPSSVHLVGYFDGVFDGNESGEDVESDGYSDEKEEDESDDDLDGFIVSTDEDYEEEDDEDWLSEEDDTRVPNAGVIIEELPSEETEVPNGSLVPFKKNIEHSKQENDSNNALVQSKQGSISSEDEDGFRLINKRKRGTEAATGVVNSEKEEEETEAAAGQPIPEMSREDVDDLSVGHKKKHKKAGNEPHVNEMSSHLPEENPESKPPGVVVEHENETDSKNSSKKKKKKKKKKEKVDSLEDLSAETVAEMNGVKLTSSDEASPTRLELEKDNQESFDSRKNLVRKHPNGLEIKIVKIGKPDGKQATPGRKIGMIYTGRLQSNGKIFDSNVGKRPFFFQIRCRGGNSGLGYRCKWDAGWGQKGVHYTSTDGVWVQRSTGHSFKLLAEVRCRAG